MENDYRNDRRDARDVEIDSNTSWGWVWAAFLIILLVAAFGWWGWGWDRSPGTNMAQRGNPEDVLRENVGRSVNITGKVKEVLHSNAFVIGGDSTFNNQDVLVVTRKPLNEQPIPVSTESGQAFQVSGEVKKFSRAELSNELGISLSESELGKYEGKPVIVADSINAPGAQKPSEFEPR